MNVKRSDLLSVELDNLARVGRRVVGGDHGVGLRPACEVHTNDTNTKNTNTNTWSKTGACL